MAKTTLPRKQRSHIVRLSVLVDKEIVRRLKIAAAIGGKTMSQALEELLKAQLPELPPAQR